ncbi:hypothetical protein AVEN_176939-1 [Araneus ventricosus]|uniref:Cuticle protein 16.8 n=1 Tax=Araneus ventricosus TaxID=182803 RepID=A0A4Y2K9T3_ARAVE|nr:hypothetical protein AVEN_176939-1 [Araneus ventricosus]
MFLLVVLSCVVLARSQHHGDINLHPQPYAFGYSVRDHHSEQHRQENGNGHGAVVGSYGFTDARGIARQVNYVADHAGFRARVNTNEPGTSNQNPAAVQLVSHQPHTLRAIEPVHAAGVVAVAAVHGLGTGYGLGLDGNGYGGALRYSGLLQGYGGVVNFATPLIGGAVRGYDSRFVNVAL